MRKEGYGIVLVEGTLSPFTHVISKLLGMDEITNEMKQADYKVMALR